MKQKKCLPATGNLKSLLELVPHFESVDPSDDVGVALRDVIAACIAVELGHEGAFAAKAEAINHVRQVLRALEPVHHALVLAAKVRACCRGGWRKSPCTAAPVIACPRASQLASRYVLVHGSGSAHMPLTTTARPFHRYARNRRLP
jgi:hypothetical protein